MAKYYFDTFDGVEFRRDDMGQDCDSRETARQTAQCAFPNILRDNLPDGSRRDFIVDVRDARGMVIYTCTLSLVGRWLDHSIPPTSNRGASE
ncbi:DUF6894 family protein [Roseomonas sp. WA12]